MIKILFISWVAHCRRNDALAAKLGGKSIHINYLNQKKGNLAFALIKYFLEGIKTFKVLLKEKPSIVFVTVPPVFSGFVVYIYSLISHCNFIIDSHTGALDGAWKPFVFLHKVLSRKCITTIVTNDHLRKIVSSWGVHVTIIGDIVINFPQIEQRYLSDKFNLVYIGTFSSDEPLETVLKVASKLPQSEFYVTGNLKHDKKNLHKKYSLRNVTFTDFLPDAEYLQLLKSADAAMILTTMDHTMQRGAYEAMSMGKPLIISDWPILLKTFYKGAIYVLNHEDSIAQGILNMMAWKKKLDREISELREERLKLYENKIAALRKLILNK